MNDQWPFLKKIGFLFLFIYFFLYANSTQFLLSGFISKIWYNIVPIFAKIVGHDTPITIFPQGSGDTTYNYYELLFFASIAGFLALMIGSFDFKRPNYKTLLRWLTLLLRYYLAAQMINYGLAKLYYLQFSFPGAARLDQELGDFSPMGLLWTFMGYSKGYTMFTGALELIGGLLLLSRNTTTLGALTTFGVMLNVMMLNYCYDVPVKILSTHMVIMSLFLIALDGKRILGFFVSNQATKPMLLEGVVPDKQRKVKNIVKWLALIGYLAYSFYEINDASNKYGEGAPKPFFHGKYTIESFYKYNDSLQLQTLTDSVRWDAMYQSRKGVAAILTGSKRKFYIKMDTDTVENILSLSLYRDTIKDVLHYEQLDSTRYHVFGKFQQDSLDMIFRKENLNDRLLIRRKFHWINEYPFNR